MSAPAPPGWWTPCPDCGSEVTARFDDAVLRDRGAFTLTCHYCLHETFVPEETSARTRIGALRTIVRDHSARRVDGLLVDALTAGMLVAVYDALSPAHRERFGKVPLERLVEVGWRCVK